MLFCCLRNEKGCQDKLRVAKKLLAVTVLTCIACLIHRMPFDASHPCGHTLTPQNCALANLLSSLPHVSPLILGRSKQADLRFLGWIQVKVADADLLTDWQRKNKEYKQRHQLNAHRESDTMARLMKFRQNLQAPRPESQAEPEDSPSTTGAVLWLAIAWCNFGYPLDIVLIVCCCKL